MTFDSNGKIATVDAQNSFVSTVVVDDGKIIAVGDASVAEGYTAEKTLDLGGKTVLPGFVDNHVHPGPPQPLVAPTEVDLVHAYTWAENEKILRAAVKNLPPGVWLRASAFRRYFTRHMNALRVARWGEPLYRRFRLFLWGSATGFDSGLVQAYRWVLRMPERGS